MWGAIIGGALSAAGSIGSSFMNAESTAGANKYNIKLWREQAAYNTPANQMKRFREAGLNPNLIYSQGNAGNITSTPTVQPAHYNFDFAQAIDKMAVVKQMKNMDEQNKNLQAQNNNLNETTESIHLENKLKKMQLELYEKYGLLPQGAGNTWWKQLIKYGKDLWDNPDFQQAIQKESPLNYNSNAAQTMTDNSIIRSLFSPKEFANEQAKKMYEPKGRIYFKYKK